MSYYRTLLIETISPYLANLIAYYPFNSDANDFSGNSYNGTLVGTGITFTAGTVGNAINFPNNSNLVGVTIPDNDDFSFTNGTNDLPFSISIWTNVTAFSLSLNPIFRKLATSNYEYQLYLNRLGGIFFVKYGLLSISSTQTISSANGLVTTGVKNHIVITNSGGLISGINIYFNGILLTSVTRTSAGSYTRMANGIALPSFNDSLATANFKFRGWMNEAYIWKNREITAVEALDIYNKGNSGQTLI